MEPIDQNNACTIRQISLLGMDLCNRLKESLNQVPTEPDSPEYWIIAARQQFEKLAMIAIKAGGN